jgi:hypothetical protein
LLTKLPCLCFTIRMTITKTTPETSYQVAENTSGQEEQEIRRGILREAQKGMDRVLDEYGGITLSIIAPDMTKEEDDREFQPTTYTAFPEGIVINHYTKAVYIPENADFEVVSNFLNAKDRDIAYAMNHGSNVAVNFTILQNPDQGQHRHYTETANVDEDDLAPYTPTLEPWAGTKKGRHHKDPDKLKTTDTKTAFRELTPTEQDIPEAEKAFEIFTLVPEGDRVHLMENPYHNLTLTYYYAIRRALGMRETDPKAAKEAFLKNYQPIILSPNLVILKTLKKAEDDSDDGQEKSEKGEEAEEKAAKNYEEIVVLARGTSRKRWGEDYWHIHKYPRGGSDNISEEINRNLHIMEKSEYYGFDPNFIPVEGYGSIED